MKEKEYKRMISRIKAITTYFKNQIPLAESAADDLFTSTAYYTMVETLERITDSYNEIYGGTNNEQ